MRDGRPAEALPLVDRGLRLARETSDLRAERALLRVRAYALAETGGYLWWVGGWTACARVCPSLLAAQALLALGQASALLRAAVQRPCPALRVAPRRPMQAAPRARWRTCSRRWRCRGGWARGPAATTTG